MERSLGCSTCDFTWKSKAEPAAYLVKIFAMSEAEHGRTGLVLDSIQVGYFFLRWTVQGIRRAVFVFAMSESFHFLCIMI